MIRLKRLGLLIAGVAFAAIGLGSEVAPAQPTAYPERPIRVVYPYAPGGVGDNIMRLLAPTMERKLGQPLVIESKPGAAGNIGTGEVARAQPDGYTILVAATNNYVINQFLTKLSFDPLADLTPIAKAAEIPLVLFSNPNVPAKDLREFLAYARANPGKLNYGTPSTGTVNHLLIERLKQTANVDLTHIPYRGSPPAVQGLLSNDIQLFPVGLAAGSAHLQVGKMTAIAVATEQRFTPLPEVPTIIESGFPGFTAANYWGMSAPKGTPASVIRRLHEAVAEALKDETVLKRFAALGIVVPTLTQEQFAVGLKAEAALWSDIIKRGKIEAK